MRRIKQKVTDDHVERAIKLGIINYKVEAEILDFSVAISQLEALYKEGLRPKKGTSLKKTLDLMKKKLYIAVQRDKKLKQRLIQEGVHA